MSSCGIPEVVWMGFSAFFMAERGHSLEAQTHALCQHFPFNSSSAGFGGLEASGSISVSRFSAAPFWSSLWALEIHFHSSEATPGWVVVRIHSAGGYRSCRRGNSVQDSHGPVLGTQFYKFKLPRFKPGLLERKKEQVQKAQGAEWPRRTERSHQSEGWGGEGKKGSHWDNRVLKDLYTLWVILWVLALFSFQRGFHWS